VRVQQLAVRDRRVDHRSPAATRRHPGSRSPASERSRRERAACSAIAAP
jgi:hypothetical protein